MAMNLAGIQNVLKTKYLGMFVDVLQRIMWTWAWLKKGSLTWSGEQIVRSIRLKGINAMSWGVGGAALNTSQKQTPVKMIISMLQGWCPIEFTYDAQMASRKGDGAFIDAMALEMEYGIKDFKDMMERVAWGDGTGKLGEVESYNAGTTTITCSAITDAAGSGLNGNAGNRYIKEGMLLDIYNGSSARMQGAVVTAVSPSADTVTITIGTGSNPAAGDSIYLHMPDGSTPISKEPMGIPGIIDNASWNATLQNVDWTTTYPQFRATAINVGTSNVAPGQINADQVQRAIDLCREAGPGSTPELWCHNSVKREVIKLGTTDIRFKPLDLQLGIRENTKSDESKPSNSLSFNEFKLRWAPDCPWQTMFGWPEGLIRQYPVFDGPKWVPNDPSGGGGILQRKTGVAGTYEGQLSWMGNIGTDLMGPNSSFVMRYIDGTIDRTYNV